MYGNYGRLYWQQILRWGLGMISEISRKDDKRLMIEKRISRKY